METHLEPVRKEQSSIFATSPKETLAFAIEIANALSPIFESQNMYAMIQGKKYPKVESWLTLGAIIGILPRESRVTEMPDGSYEAHVDLVNKTGGIVGGASAICGIEEKRWSNADRYARRSMSVTRATAKAYRIAFSWIMQLAGLEATPAEEMPHEAPPAPQQKTTKVVVVTPEKSKKYDPQNREHQDGLIKLMTARNIPEDQWDLIGNALAGRPSTDLDKVIEEVTL